MCNDTSSRYAGGFFNGWEFIVFPGPPTSEIDSSGRAHAGTALAKCTIEMPGCVVALDSGERAHRFALAAFDTAGTNLSFRQAEDVGQ